MTKANIISHDKRYQPVLAGALSELCNESTVNVTEPGIFDQVYSLVRYGGVDDVLGAQAALCLTWVARM